MATSVPAPAPTTTLGASCTRHIAPDTKQCVRKGRYRRTGGSAESKRSRKRQTKGPHDGAFGKESGPVNIGRRSEQGHQIVLSLTGAKGLTNLRLGSLSSHPDNKRAFITSGGKHKVVL